MIEEPLVLLLTEAPGDYGGTMPPGELPESVTIDPSASSDAPCLDVNGNVPYLTVDNRDTFWASDETLQLLRDWLDLESRPWSNTSEYAGREGETAEEHIERVERLTEEAWAEYDALQPRSRPRARPTSRVSVHTPPRRSPSRSGSARST